MSNQYLKLRRSNVKGKIPTTESIDFGEIALNTYDGLAYMKVSGSDGIKVVPIGSSSGSFSGSFQGTFTGDGSGLTNLPTQSFNTGSLVTTASFNAFTASYNTGSFTGSFVGTFTGSLYGTASWALNTLTASFIQGLTGGQQYYVPVWTDSSSLGTSSLYESGSVLKTVSGSVDVGLSLDFVNNRYSLGADPIGYGIGGFYVDTNTCNNYVGDGSNNYEGINLQVNNNPKIIKTQYQGNDIGLKLDFANSIYEFGSDLGIGSKGIKITNPSGGGGAKIELGDVGGVYANGTSVVIDDYTYSITVTGSLNAPVITGSLHGTASWANNALTSSRLSGFNLQLTNPPSNGDLLIYDSNIAAWENSKSLTGSYQLSGSFTTNGENIVCGSLIITNNSVISGSLFIGNNLTVIGSSTLVNLTSSQLDLGTSILEFTTFAPATTYGGIAVKDSGSQAPLSSSLIYNVIGRDWIITEDRGTGITSSLMLLGPQTFANQGNETPLTLNRLPKGTGTQHLNDSNITDNGSVVTVNSNTTISGSLTVRENLIVLGSASIQYISESTLNIGTNLITVNTFNPGARFGGLAVIDSGSSPLVSASFLYDSVQDEFIFVHKGTAGGAITSSHFVLGPETYNDQGNEIYLTQNRIPKGTGIEHLNDSNISDDGSIIKTIYGGNDIGLKLDFANGKYVLGDEPTGLGFVYDAPSQSYYFGDYGQNGNTIEYNSSTAIVTSNFGFANQGLRFEMSNGLYQFGQLTGGQQTYLTINDPTNTVSISGSTVITGSLAVSGLSAGIGSGDVIMYNTSSGQFFFTGSSAIGGGNASNDNFQQIFLLMGG